MVFDKAQDSWLRGLLGSNPSLKTLHFTNHSFGSKAWRKHIIVCINLRGIVACVVILLQDFENRWLIKSSLITKDEHYAVSWPDPKSNDCADNETELYKWQHFKQRIIWDRKRCFSGKAHDSIPIGPGFEPPECRPFCVQHSSIIMINFIIFQSELIDNLEYVFRKKTYQKTLI
jgi:hypothetical protein